MNKNWNWTSGDLVRRGVRKGNKHKTFKNRTQVYDYSGDFFIIDNKDWPLVKLHTWNIGSQHKIGKNRYTPNFYVKTSVPESIETRRHHLAVHRLITNAPEGILVDHIDGNPKNNKRSNLRFATHAQNGINRRGTARNKVIGVSWDQERERFVVRLTINGKLKKFGRFKEKEDAEEKAIAMSLLHHGEYSPYYKGATDGLHTRRD